MPDPTNPEYPSLLHSTIATVCDRFEAELRAGKKPKIEDFLGDMPEPTRTALLRELQSIEAEIHEKMEEPRVVSPRPPEAAQAASREHAEWVVSQSTRDTADRRQDAAAEDTPAHPAQIGKYRIEQVLGRGSFGTVYQGFDTVLKRHVAIKVPHPHMVSKPEDVELYLEEGQVLASLDHPHIVPVFEADRTTDGRCYVVSKFIEGTNLGARIKQSPLSHPEAAEIVAVVAEALHHFASPQDRASGHQARQHPPRLQRQALRSRFRLGAHRRAFWIGLGLGGDVCLYEPGTGPGRRAPGGREVGHFQFGSGLL